MPLPAVATPPSITHPEDRRWAENKRWSSDTSSPLSSPLGGPVTPGLLGLAPASLTCCPGLFSSGPEPSLSAGAVNTADARGGGRGERAKGGGETGCEAAGSHRTGTVTPSCPWPLTSTHRCRQGPPRSFGCCSPHPQSAPPARSGDRRREGFSPWTLIRRDPRPRGPPLVPTVPGSVWGTQRRC